MAEPSDSLLPGLNLKGLKYLDKLLPLFDPLHIEVTSCNHFPAGDCSHASVRSGPAGANGRSG